jgi:hypothetical protein
MPINLNENQLYEEYNKLSSFELCYQGQELVQELVSKLVETVTIYRHLSIYLLHGDHNSYLHRKQRLEELLNFFESVLKRLRVISYVLSERKSNLENHNSNKDPFEINQDLDSLNKQKLELQGQIKLKNKYLKLSIDKLSDIIWNINSIQSIKQN